MAIYTNLPIYKASYSLLLALTKITPNMPRECRYTLAQECRRKIMEIILLIYRANRIKEKVKMIMDMRECLLEAQVYIRLMCDMRSISEKQYAYLMEETVSMSKQMSSWEKSERNKCGDNLQ